MTHQIKDCHCFGSDGSYNWTVDGCVHADLALAALESKFKDKDIIAFGLKQINGKSKSYLIYKNYFEKPEIFDCAIRVKSYQTVHKLAFADSEFIDDGEDVDFSQDSFLSSLPMSYINKKLLMTQKYVYGMDSFYCDDGTWPEKADKFVIKNDRNALIVEEICISDATDDILMSTWSLSKKSVFNSKVFGIIFLWLLKIENVLDDFHIRSSTSVKLFYTDQFDRVVWESESLKTWFDFDSEKLIIELVDQPSNIISFGDYDFFFTPKGLRNYIFSLEEVRYESLLAAWDLI